MTTEVEHQSCPYCNSPAVVAYELMSVERPDTTPKIDGELLFEGRLSQRFLAVHCTNAECPGEAT
jgi:hypothetical protein